MANGSCDRRAGVLAMIRDAAAALAKSQIMFIKIMGLDTRLGALSQFDVVFYYYTPKGTTLTCLCGSLRALKRVECILETLLSL
jgi:hypothetical protein